MVQKIKLTKQGIEQHPQWLSYNVFHVETFGGEGLDYNSFRFTSDSIEEFDKFCSENDIKNIFYSFGYYDEDLYYIYDTEVEEVYGEKVSELLTTEIEKHNSKIDKVDFSKPNKCYLFSLFQSHIFYIVLIDDWLGKKNIVPSFLKTHELVMTRMDEISEFMVDKEEDVLNALDNLRDEILNDAHFRYQNTKKKRYEYFLEFLENEGDEIVEEIFFSPEGEPYEQDIREFIEILWRDKKMTQ